MHATEALAEADRLMTLCNSCRYCEGICAVFPAMELRREFKDGDLNYLANLCHSCGACYDDCQFSPPHEFNINVPVVLAKVRAGSYAAYAAPAGFSGLFQRNGLTISLALAVSVATFILAFGAASGPSFVTAQSGAGAFYRIMPHQVMALLFGLAFLYAIVALAMGVRNFWRDIGAASGALPSSLWQAIKDAGSLHYLDGGGAGCVNAGEQAKDMRKHYHHATFYGFFLCFAATCVGTLYHYAGWEAPYAWYDLPVLLGALGGIGLVVGPAGLFAAKLRRASELKDEARFGMDVGFIAMLFLTGITGILLLMLRDTAAMNLLLAVHLGVVFALFVTMPYGKFVHGIYRFVALVRYAQERRAGH